ncbi:molybdopterin-dependent oxidoreductase [Larsenimonas salina]|uniref:molybdopterin-dependent oxidoreductase n=1 Tax=Larsenimonas salina TaxID=1295565 RepID=UPI002074565D|nr:molybdopterin-dependent oxidoreductase [Larsenimonas salina]MCM5704184.1 molybdopterin-dependent oxidoreductase [Larsenimonas salina]
MTHMGTLADADRGPGPYSSDLNPNPLPEAMLALQTHGARVSSPMVRVGWREGDRGARRGEDRFEPVSWAAATRLVHDELTRVSTTHGNEAIYAGSYGWGSAGRFHHAQSQLKRLLNLYGGFTGSKHTYSYGAGAVIVPHVLGQEYGGTNACAPAWAHIERHTDLMVAFGGFRAGNTRCDAGGVLSHEARGALARACRRGMTLIVVSPDAADAPDFPNVHHVPIRPTTDAALLLALCTWLIDHGRADRAFVNRFCVGGGVLARYLEGRDDGVPKTAAWAEAITGVPRARIEWLAERLARATRPLVALSWSLQRARFAEQPYWAAIALASHLGAIGTPGGGVAFGLGSVNSVGLGGPAMAAPGVPQGHNPVTKAIPVAALGEMLARPGEALLFNGETHSLPEIKLVYWAGGNPFHHHQDLNRLHGLWQRPETVVVHEPVWSATARRADIVLPVTLPSERADIAGSSFDRHLVYSSALHEPRGQARTDHAICTAIAAHGGKAAAFTDGLTVEGWLERLYGGYRARHPELPSFETFKAHGAVSLTAAEPERLTVPLKAFIDAPEHAPLSTPSGRIELFSQTIEGFGCIDCGPHPRWQAPEEWLGGALARRFPLHLLSPQPHHRLHSQGDPVGESAAHKIEGREAVTLSRQDADARGLRPGQTVKLFNDRGACLAGLSVSDTLMPGVAVLPTGAWLEYALGLFAQNGSPLECAGNPNVLTADRPSSTLSWGCGANSCLIEVVAATSGECAARPARHID